MVMLVLAVIFTSMPRAPEISKPSRNGLNNAPLTASAARLSPAAADEPIIALPISCITVVTSAKSTLIRPWRVISSAIPCTAPCSTSLAIANASVMGESSTSSNFSFEMVINESTNSESSEIPLSAIFIRRLPSKRKGLETTATVKIPISFACCAMTGAAPVPVPPPMPAVINTMSAPSSASAIRS